MPPIKKDQIIESKEVIKAFEDINKAVKVTLEQFDKLIADGKELQTTFANAKGIKDYSDALNKLNKNRVDAEKLTKQQIDLLKKEESLKQAVARTTAAQEKAIQSKNRTAEQEARITEKQTREAAKLTSAYAQESKRLTELRNKAKDLAITFGENSKQFRQAEKDVVKLDNRLKNLDARLGQSQRNVGNYKSGLAGLSGGVKNLLGAFGVIGGIQLFSKALRSAFEISKRYEKQNAILASVLGKTVKQTSELQKQSKDLGASTAFSATQVTELQTELARLGKTENEILASTEGIIDATLALGSDTGETAALVGATLNAFQLGANESGRVADVLTLSTQRSALSFEKLNVAIPITAGAAAAAGVSLEKMTSQLGKAADRGIDASTAATSLRNIYIELAAKGITYEEAINKINTSTDKLSTATDLFGKRAAVTALALADTTEETDILTKALENAGGTAKKVAQTQLNTLDGQLKLLNSAWEGLVLNINNSDTALGKFSVNTVKFATNAINQFANIGKEAELLRRSLIGGFEDADASLLKYIADTGRVEDSNGNIRSVKEVLDEVAESYKKLTFEEQQFVDVNNELAVALLKAGGESEAVDGIVREYVKGLKLEKDALEDLNFEYDDEADLLDIDAKNKKELNEITKESIRLADEEIKRLDRQTKVPDKLKRILEDPEDKPIEKSKSVIEAEENAQKRFDIFAAEQERKSQIFEDEEKRRTEIAREQEQLRRDVANFGLDTALQVSDALFENSNIRRENELQAEIEAGQKRLDNEKLDDEQREEIQKQLAEREKELRRKKAEQDKRNSIFQIGIETAVGIARAIAESPLTFGLPFSAFVAGQGAVQAALVASRPIPQFDKGVKYAPDEFIAGEKRPEFMKHKGKVTLIDKPTYFGKEYKGAEIIGGAETATILENITRNEIADNKSIEYKLNMDYTNAILKKGFRDLSKSLRNEPKSHNNFRMAEYINKFSE